MQDQATLTKPSSTVVITGIIIAAAFPSLSMALLEVWFTKSPVSFVWAMSCSRLVFWVEVLFLWWYAIQFENQKLIIWKERQSDLLFILEWTLLLLFAAFAVNLLSTITTRLGFAENYRQLRILAKFMAARPLLVLFVSITAGVCEEIIFRAYILTRLSLLFKNQYVPIIISSVLFSVMHYKYHSAREFLFTFLIGLIMALHYNKYRNIKPLIIVHFLFDWFALSVLPHFIKG